MCLALRDRARLSWVAAFLLLLFFGIYRRALAQCPDGSTLCGINMLGAHDNGGRGCVGCHPLHIGDEARPSQTQAAISPEVAHVLLCLSCHDGNIAPENMMADESHASRLGQPGRSARGSMPWLRSIGAHNVSADHPVGPDAVIPVGNGLEFSNGKFSVLPGSLYARFVDNYGWPTLAQVRGARRYGINEDGRPYLLCTTCHNPHATSVYASSPESPIAGDGGGRYYSTYYFLNAPYNPETHNQTSGLATSNVQFCRQCHFALSNEANNTFSIPTRF